MNRPARAPGRRLLTGCGREIASCVASGPSNDDIGTVLMAGPAMVRTHASRALTKLGARDRAQLVVFACQSGIPVPTP